MHPPDPLLDAVPYERRHLTESTSTPANSAPRNRIVVPLFATNIGLRVPLIRLTPPSTKRFGPFPTDIQAQLVECCIHNLGIF